MRTILDVQEELIVDLIADGTSGISPAALEKDALVTEALRAISEVSLPGFALTFSGGMSRQGLRSPRADVGGYRPTAAD